MKKLSLLSFVLSVLITLFSCGNSSRESKEQASSDSIWWTFSSPILKMYALNGHVTKATYSVYASNKEGVKIQKLHEYQVCFDKDGICENEKLEFPLLWVTCDSEFGYNDDGTMNSCMIHSNIPVKETHYYAKFNYNEEGTLLNISKLKDYDSTNPWWKDVLDIKLEYNSKKLISKIDYVSYCFQKTYGDKMYFVKYTATNEYIEYDDHDNWTCCLQERDGKYFLFTRDIEAIPYSQE